VLEAAKHAAVQLGLAFEHRHVGIKGLADSIPVTFGRNETTKASV
jgi:hypothetical protein